MSADMVVNLMSETLYLIIKVSAPMLLVSLVVGLIVSILQTVTSIQEQTLTFVPKILGIFLTIMLLGHWMINNMVNYMTQLWNDIPLYIR